MVNLTVRLLAKPAVGNLTEIHRRLGQDYEERVLPAIANEVMKAVVARYDAAQLLTRRAEVSREIRRRLIHRARLFHIILDDVSIVRLPPLFAGAPPRAGH